MLSRDDNEMLVRVGPGTGMGEFFRLFWIPFLLSKDLVADGRPKRVRLLGENLVAFRASDNTIGLLDHACRLLRFLVSRRVLTRVIPANAGSALSAETPAGQPRDSDSNSFSSECISSRIRAAVS